MTLHLWKCIKARRALHQTVTPNGGEIAHCVRSIDDTERTPWCPTALQAILCYYEDLLGMIVITPEEMIEEPKYEKPKKKGSWMNDEKDSSGY